MTRVAFICLGAYHIQSWTKEQNFDRQSMYSVALSEALRIAKAPETKAKNLECDFFIVDNTVSNQDQIIEEFREQLTDPLIKDLQLINDNSLGSKNKGAGEYGMCRAVVEKHKETLAQYDWIVYYTLRQVIVAPLVLKAVYESSVEKDQTKAPSVVVAGAYALHSSGLAEHFAAKNYCDMIFAMRPDLFFGYVDSMTPEELAAKRMNSEHNLYNYIEIGVADGTMVRRELPRLGVMRYDNVTERTQIV
jgi:hypothetical protein